MFSQLFLLLSAVSGSVPKFYRRFSEISDFGDNSHADFYGTQFLREVNPIRSHRQRLNNFIDELMDQITYEEDQQKPEDDESFLQLLQLLH